MSGQVLSRFLASIASRARRVEVARAAGSSVVALVVVIVGAIVADGIFGFGRIGLFVLDAAIVAALVGLAAAAPAWAQQAAGRFLGREEIKLYGLGLRVTPAQQTVPRDIATIVSTFLDAPQQVDGLPPFAPGAVVRATLRGPSFATPIEPLTFSSSSIGVGGSAIPSGLRTAGARVMVPVAGCWPLVQFLPPA